MLASSIVYGYQYFEKCDKESIQSGTYKMPVAMKLNSGQGGIVQFVNYKLCSSDSAVKRLLLSQGRTIHPVIMY